MTKNDIRKRLEEIKESQKEVEAVANRLKEEQRELQLLLEGIMSSNDRNCEYEIASYLKKVGVPGHLKGYLYLKEAIQIVLKERMMFQITKVYPEIAEKYKTTASRVERAIRSAISVAWTRRNVEFQDELFGYSIDSKKGRPTSSEFIATIADHINILHMS